MSNPKCRYCGKEITDKKTAVKILSGSRNKFYCNREEYNLSLKEKEEEHKIKEEDKEFLKEIEMIIDMYIDIESKSSWDNLDKEFIALSKNYPKEHICQFLTSEIEKYSKVLDKKEKDFENEFRKIRYFIAIVKNNINDYVKNHPLVKNEPQVRDVDFYMAPINYRPTKQRRAMVDIEEGDDD